MEDKITIYAKNQSVEFAEWLRKYFCQSHIEKHYQCTEDFYGDFQIDQIYPLEKLYDYWNQEEDNYRG